MEHQRKKLTALFSATRVPAPKYPSAVFEAKRTSLLQGHQPIDSFNSATLAMVRNQLFALAKVLEDGVSAEQLAEDATDLAEELQNVLVIRAIGGDAS